MPSPSFRYFPVTEAQTNWGLHATCAGHTESAPRTPFPPSGHPDEYYFSWEVGRILHEWQLILVEAGRGQLEFRNRRPLLLQPGALIILPPGAWHRYRPNDETGWTTRWFGFGGALTARLTERGFFDAQGDVRNLAAAPPLVRSFRDVVDHLLSWNGARPLSAAAHIWAFISELADTPPGKAPDTARAQLIRQAQTFIAQNSAQTVDFAALAARLGLPYRTFRHVFTRETGMPPLHYQLAIRFKRARNLLQSSDLAVAEIAHALGFSSPWRFSHAFTRAVGLSPLAYRMRHRTRG